MKRFNNYYKEFVSYVKGIDGCPQINEITFCFAYKDKKVSEYDEMHIHEVEKIFNSFLDQGYSWINIICSKIVKGKLFVTFEMSRSHYPEFVGRTDIKFCGPTQTLSGEIIWNPVEYYGCEYTEFFSCSDKFTKKVEQNKEKET
jgi:hypothetical protein